MTTPVVTIPLYLAQDRPFVDLTLTGPGGQTRTVRAWIDTGHSNLLITESVARDLGLTWTPIAEHPTLAPAEIASAQIGGHQLDLTGARVFIDLNGLHAGVQAEAIISGQILARRHVIFDYPNRTLTIALPGAVAPRGIPVPTPFVPGICFPRLEAEIDGERYGLLLDTGATCTMISTKLLTTLAQQHPDWPRTTGAAGVANMLGEWDAQLPLVRLPQITVGDVQFDGVLAVGRPPGNFEEFMSRWMTAPIIGALAGQALKHFRVEIDYANQTTYFERRTSPALDEMDLVGVILHAHPDGSFTLGGTARACGYPDGAARPGDRLLAVDDYPVRGLSRPEVLDRLRGVPGEVRRLSLERGGDQVEVTLPVVRVI